MVGVSAKRANLSLGGTAAAADVRCACTAEEQFLLKRAIRSIDIDQEEQALGSQTETA